MKFSEFCIKRPVFATVINLIVIFIGLVSYERLTIREYPNVDIPVVNIETVLPGANPELVESQVTMPLEESLAGIEGINYMVSHSRPETSEITVKFLLNKDPNVAASDVRDRIGRVRDRLPKDAKESIISKVEANADPIIWLAFSSNRYSSLEMSDLLNHLVKDRLQTLPGVASIMIFGERRYSMRLWINPERLAAYHLTPSDVEDALRAQNIEVPAGRIINDTREFSVLTATDLSTPEQFENIALKNINNHIVRVKDIAKVEVAAKEKRQIARFNGKEAIAIGVVKQSTANPLEVSKNVKANLPAIIDSLPQGIEMQVAYDSSIYIKSSIHSVFKTIIEAVVLVTLVIFLFLRSFRATIIPLVTIPVSLIGAFGIMYLLHFSINTLTLLAMVLAIGLVVDDAIVVLENIYRHIEAGMDRVKASIVGINEIGFAVIAMTLTLVFVFAPIAFAQGQTGKLFIEFALTLASAVLVSGFAALSLTPMMCSRILKKDEQQGKFYSAIEEFLKKLTHRYQKSLIYYLQHRQWVVLLILIAFIITGLLLTTLKSELAPSEDKGYFMAIAIGPEGASLNYTSEYVAQMEKMYSGFPEIESNFSAIGFPMVSRAASYVSLVPWGDRKKSVQEVVAALTPKMLYGIPGVMAFPLNPPSLGQNEISQPIEIVLQTTSSYPELKQVVDRVLNRVRNDKVLENIDMNLHLNSPQLKISVDRNKIAALGASVEDVSRTIESLVSGRQVTRYKRGSEQFDVIIQVPEQDRITPDDLYSIYVKGKNNQMIPLSNLVSVQEIVSASELNHFNKMRAATITATLGKGVGLSQGLAYLENIINDIAPSNYQIDYGGISREYYESQNTLLFIFALALCFIYLVLAAQFESFRDPLVILISVPLAMSGALLSLKLSGGTLNIYSQIGLITLIGLISKHGILIVEFSNQLKEKGIPLFEAIVQASTLRLRPILMTTGAMVLGAIPLALASGAGAEARQQMGWVIVGGLLVGTTFTLFVVPVVYSFLTKTKGESVKDPVIQTSEGANV